MNNVAFTRNRVTKTVVFMESYSSATIQNNTLTENGLFGIIYILFDMSNMQLDNVEFTRNILMTGLMYIKSMSNATVKNTNIVGNFIDDPAFNIISANLVIDTTLLYNNFFTHYLISVISCDMIVLI